MANLVQTQLISRLVIAAMLVSAPVWPASADGGGPAQGSIMVALRSAPATLRPDRAYILLRVDQTQSELSAVQPVFLRKPTDSELADYHAAKKAAFESEQAAQTTRGAGDGTSQTPTPPDDYEFTYDKIKNIFYVGKNLSIAGDKNYRTYLLEVTPGDYVFYGSSFYAIPSSAIVLDTCDCLGTVEFHANPGVITDLGTFFFDQIAKKSAVPELATLSGIGKIFGDTVIGAAIRPPTKEAATPAILSPFPIEAADYHAVGTFIEPGSENIFRIAPMPGVLHYENGRVFDEKKRMILP